MKFIIQLVIALLVVILTYFIFNYLEASFFSDPNIIGAQPSYFSSGLPVNFVSWEDCPAGCFPEVNWWIFVLDVGIWYLLIATGWRFYQKRKLIN